MGGWGGEHIAVFVAGAVVTVLPTLTVFLRYPPCPAIKERILQHAVGRLPPEHWPFLGKWG